jgi:hypothetical protein
VKTSNQDKHDDTKDNFSEGLGFVFYQFAMYQIKIILEISKKKERGKIFLN